MFFLQFGELNLKAQSYSKTLITQKLPHSCAPTLFRSIYSQDQENSFCLNVALKKCKILTFLLFFLLLSPLLLNAQYNLVSADILKNHGVHPVPLGKWSKLSGFPYIFPNNFFLHHNYANKWSYKEFALQWSFVATLC